MTKWGTQLTDIEYNYIRTVPSHIQKSDNCIANNCIEYMYLNGFNIYKEMYQQLNMSDNVTSNYIYSIMNTDNDIKDIFFNDEYIQSIKQNIIIDEDDNNKIINYILLLIRPYILTPNEINAEELKQKVINTINFNTEYMTNIETQLEFLFSESIINNIRNNINNDLDKQGVQGVNDIIKSDKLTDEHIKKILKNNIDNYSTKSTVDNTISLMPEEINNVYYHSISKFNELNLFMIINNTKERIKADIIIESNQINNNIKLDKWNTIYGDHNKLGLRRYSNIKLNERKPMGMMFNMNY